MLTRYVGGADIPAYRGCIEFKIHFDDVCLVKLMQLLTLALVDVHSKNIADEVHTGLLRHVLHVELGMMCVKILGDVSYACVGKILGQGHVYYVDNPRGLE